MHKEKHFQQSEFVRDIVIGLSDGLTVPFALAAGLSSAVHYNKIIITAGIAEIIAGSIAMGLGGYLAGRTEIDHYHSELDREYREIKEFNDVERQEVKDIFAQYGLSAESQEVIINEMVKDEDKWVDFMMRYELGIEKPDIHRAKKSAFNIGGAYIVGGVIPLMGYIFTQTPNDGLLYSAIITVVCLLTFGYLKSRVTGQHPLSGALKVASIGIIAATAAYFIAKIFSN
jgi:VIT1/CCC1 family predicted Fe2+/Mn2+ transporter